MPNLSIYEHTPMPWSLFQVLSEIEIIVLPISSNSIRPNIITTVIPVYSETVQTE